MSYIRIVIPSWRLFDRVGFVPRLYYRIISDDQVKGEWQPVVFSISTQWHSLFFNPVGNLHHAIHNSLERLVEKPEDEKNQEVVRKIMHYFLQKEKAVPKGVAFEFQVTVLVRAEGKWVEQQVICSSREIL